MLWIRRRLAIRQTVYAVAVVAILASAISAFEIVMAYQAEHGRQERFVAQLSHAFLESAGRAAFHVDAAQADTVVGGLMSFDTVAWARIRTDLSEVLAERTRTTERGSMDSLSRWLFSDVAQHVEILTTATTRVPVGTLSFGISPERVGRGFISRLGTLLAGLLVEFFVLATALAIIFHKTLIRPLTEYTRSIEAIDHEAAEIPSIEMPRGHEQDELGLLVSQTNRLFARLEEQRAALVHREKIAALGTMLTGAAHELNNPLAVVTAQAQILKDTTDDDAIIQRADKILRPAERCAKIVRSFLELARQRKTEKLPIDIREVIRETIDLVAYRLKTGGVEINVRIAENLPTILGDAVQVSQAVMNLLINAQQAMADQAPPRTIDLDVTCAAGVIEIRVADVGPGIPAALRNRVVEPFFTTKTQGRGTGLGLAFCSNVAASHGGSLAISDHEPQGAVVTLTLAAERVPLPREQAKALAATVEPLRVLVVEDEEELAQSFAEALTLRGHQVETEFDGATALPTLESKTFDVIVADIRMPDVGGIELFNRTTRRFPDLLDRFVFVTGEPVSDDTAAFLREHPTPCLPKPFDLAELATAVEGRAPPTRAPS